jgi:serine-type D-Ala-D-Ala carboxypeptidase (penicillin-binding protein 5/6)
VSRRTITGRVRVGRLVLAALLAAATILLVPAAALAADLGEPITIKPAFPGEAPKIPRITAKGAVLVDAGTGAVLYSRNADQKLEMASTTKIMTAILILESLPLDKKVKVPKAAVGAAGSSLGFRAGETFTVEQLLYALMVPSANDAALTLAIAEAGSVKAFVAKMNARAEKMGLTHTHFVNPNGLHAEDHYSSAKDMATLASYAMRDPMFRRVVSTREYQLPHVGGGGPRLLETSNELLKTENWVNGIKTGSTPYAGYCLVASATKNGLTLISVVLGAKDADTRAAECKALLSYGFERCRLTKLVDEGQPIAEVPVLDPLDRQVHLVAGASFSRRVLGEDEVTGQVELSREIQLPIEAGEEMGKLELSQNGIRLGSVPVIAAQGIEAASLKMILTHMSGPWFEVLPLGRLLAPAA